MSVFVKVCFPLCAVNNSIKDTLQVEDGLQVYVK